MVKIMRKLSDDIFIWFCGLGLSIGLLMALYFLYVIVVNSFFYFWPRNIYQFYLNNKTVIYGEKIEEREKKDIKNQLTKEYRIFVGNKDFMSENFIFIHKKKIASIQKKSNLIKLNRYENGPVIGELISFSDAKTPIENDNELYSLISSIKGKITSLKQNKKEMAKLVEENNQQYLILEKYAQKINSIQNEKKRNKLFKQIDTVARESEIIEEEIVKLEQQNEDNSFLAIKLFNGDLKKIKLSDIESMQTANLSSLIKKIILFIKKIVFFIVEFPRAANTEGGIFPVIFGTLMMTLVMSVLVLPFGVMAAIYLHEYANQSFFVQLLRISVNNLAGVPSIVFGIFGLGFFVYFIGGGIDKIFFSESLPSPTFGTGGMLWASFTLALLTLPVVIVSTEEALAAIPNPIRENSYACGASKWQTIRHILLPLSMPGILTGLILAMSRGAGEVAPLMLVGVVKLAPDLAIDGNFPFLYLNRKFMHLGYHIYDLGFQSPDSESVIPIVFATTLLLLVMIFMLNFLAILFRSYINKKYKMHSF